MQRSHTTRFNTLRLQPTIVGWGLSIDVSRETIAGMHTGASSRPPQSHFLWYRGLVPRCVG